MNPEPFIISIEHLNEGVILKIDTILSSDFFEIDETELSFHDPVSVTGEAYLTEDELVLHFNAATKASMPCLICNQMIPCPIEVKGCYHTEPLNGILEAQFDFRPVVREALLIELPKVVECGGNCPVRKEISPFLHQNPDPEHYYPFNDLKFPERSSSNGRPT